MPCCALAMYASSTVVRCAGDSLCACAQQQPVCGVLLPLSLGACARRHSLIQTVLACLGDACQELFAAQPPSMWHYCAHGVHGLLWKEGVAAMHVFCAF